MHERDPLAQYGLKFVAFDSLLHIVLKISDHFFTISMFYVVHASLLPFCYDVWIFIYPF